MLTGSGSQSIDLICRLLLKPAIRFSSTTRAISNFRALLKGASGAGDQRCHDAHGPGSHRVRTRATGKRAAPLPHQFRVAQPDRATLSPPVAHRLLKLAEAHDLLILEDDIFTDFEPEPSVRLAALDGLNRVNPHRQLFEDAVCLLALRLHCGACGVDRRAGDLQIAAQFGGPSPIVTHVIGEVLTAEAIASTWKRCAAA